MKFELRQAKRCARGVLALASVLVLAGPVLAGPPLICSEVMLTESEAALLAKAIDGKGDAAARVESFVGAIAASTSPRFRIEAIRWFFHQGEDARRALPAALDRRLSELADRATPQDRFDAHLAALIADWEGEGAGSEAAALSEIADATGDSARLIIAAEALDLASLGKSAEERRLASLLSLAHCRRAAAALAKPVTDEDREVARLLRAHLPHLRGMHSREPCWQKFLATFGEEEES